MTQKIFVCCMVVLLVGCSTENKSDTFSPSMEEKAIELESESLVEEDEASPVVEVAVETTDEVKEEIEVVREVVKKEPACLVFDNFSDTENSPRWYAVNDNVMGGRSLGYFEIEGEVLNFEGSINTNGGGFSSIRASLPREILSNYQRVVLNVRGDGRKYEVTFRDANRSRITHRQSFSPGSDIQWQEVSILFDDLTQAFFGRRVQSPAFDKNRALEIGLILSDGRDGPFSLEVDSVFFCE